MVSIQDVKTFLSIYYLIEVRQNKKFIKVSVPAHVEKGRPKLNFQCFLSKSVKKPGVNYKFSESTRFVASNSPEEMAEKLEEVLTIICEDRGYAYEAIDFIDSAGKSVGSDSLTVFFKDLVT